MEKEFSQFADNIRLTESQENDAKTKYDGVCNKLHTSYYESKYDGSTKFLFGSYKTKTNIRPFTDHQDVDVLFKIPKETYERFKTYKSNGPAALLQEIKDFLKEKYTTTDEIRAWGKVVLVKFADNTHNIEVLPAYEEADNKFTIPNSEDGGKWEPFNPKKEIDAFQTSNVTTNGLTADLTRMLKTWVNNTTTCNYKSYVLQGDLIKFLGNNYKKGVDYSEYSKVLRDAFQFLKKNCDAGLNGHVQTALDRAIKACEFEDEGKPKEASEEWRKIFGHEFPLVKSNPVKDSSTRVFTSPSAPYGYY